MDFETAASLPVAYLTAFVALDRLAKLQPMQSVLIHAATGGVGLASLALARASHARVFATASKPKQSFLHRLDAVTFMIRENLDSQVCYYTTQRAVRDVVVNLLDESFAEENLRCLVSAERISTSRSHRRTLQNALQSCDPMFVITVSTSLRCCEQTPQSDEQLC